MRFRKRINKRIRKKEDGIDIAADVNAAISVNIGESGRTVTRTSSTSKAHVRDEKPRREGGNGDG